MSWWDSAYRSGSVSWDPGEYDRHLDWLLRTVRIPGRSVLDLGCGAGKSVVWLAQKGFDAIGIDSAPSAIKLAKRAARDADVDPRFITGTFPQALEASQDGAPSRGFDLIIERASLQHMARGPSLRSLVEGIAEIAADDGVFYSLMLAGEGLPKSWGIEWTEARLRDLFEPLFVIEHIDRVQFTPGESGSVPAWRTVGRKPTTAPETTTPAL